MRKFNFLIIGLLLPVFLLSQDAEEKKSYMMWETMYITPDYSDLAAFGEAMKNHNTTYHASGPYHASVYNVVNGPNTGKLLWAMGPCTYSDLDSRPADDGHEDDWMNNVMPHVKKLHQGEYWKFDMELSNIGPDDGHFNIYQVRYHEVNKGEGYRIKGILSKISKAVKAMDGSNPWGVFYNEFQQGYNIGRHIATVSYFKSWSEFDEDANFKEAYEAAHGEGTWTAFINEYDSVFSNSWDELWVYNEALSAPEPAAEDDGN